MNFQPHIRQLFQLRGRTSTYTPPLGAPVALKAIRQGGGQQVMLGYVKVSPEKTLFHVLRSDVPNPVAGAVLNWDGEGFTIDAVQPVERDADGLMWELDASWGLSLTLRSTIGTGVNQAPPQGGPFAIGSPASAGATALWIKSAFLVGKLLAGDKISIAGHASEYTVTGSGVVAGSNQLAGIPIRPPLMANAALDAAVTFDFVRDFMVRAAIANYAAEEYRDTVQIGDRRIVLLQSAIDQAGMTGAPKPSDRVWMENQTFSVVSATATYQAGAPYAWELQLRKG